MNTENENVVSTTINEKSTHIVEVVRLGKIEPHPNSDGTLSITKVYDYPCVIKTSEFKEGDLVAYLPPDSEVDITRPEFSFLKKPRIRTVKLRGYISYGLLTKAPEGSKVGDNVADILGVQHYEPDIAANWMTKGDVAKAPSGVFYHYDVDAFMKYGREVFIADELVNVTEKLHGTSSRYVFKDGTQFSGSRKEWKKEFNSCPNITVEDLIKEYGGDEVKANNAYQKHVVNFKPKKNLWWLVLENTPAIRKFCETNPGFALYGETYGYKISELHYGCKPGEVKFAAFDILDPDGKWLDFPDFLQLCKSFNVPTVPVLHEALPFNFEAIVQMAEGMSTIDPSQIKEGIVAAPLQNRWDERLGRVKLKVINSQY
jgi:RNA ligase (TIGR02306 family)